MGTFNDSFGAVLLQSMIKYVLLCQEQFFHFKNDQSLCCLDIRDTLKCWKLNTWLNEKLLVTTYWPHTFYFRGSAAPVTFLSQIVYCFDVDTKVAWAFHSCIVPVKHSQATAALSCLYSQHIHKSGERSWQWKEWIHRCAFLFSQVK